MVDAARHHPSAGIRHDNTLTETTFSSHCALSRGERRSKMKNVQRKPQAFQTEVREPDPLLTPEQQERQRQAAALIRAWTKEEDDGLWPLVEEEFSLSKG